MHKLSEFFFKKKNWSQMIQNCLIRLEIAKKNFGDRWWFSAVVAVPSTFLHGTQKIIIKATAMTNLIAVTHFLAD